MQKGSYKKRRYIKEGDSFNRLTCLSFHHSTPRGRSYFLFKCTCGKEKIILGSLVVSGNTKSCGCLATENRQNRRISIHHSDITAIILGYKRHALARGLKFNLSRDEVENIVTKPCFYCGITSSNLMRTKNSLIAFPFNGIDRIDSSLDYILHNVVPCCKYCNKSKLDRSVKDFLTWISQVYNHSIKQS